MKKILILGLTAFMALTPFKLNAQSQEIQQLILNIEKLSQFKKILSDMKKGYELLSGGYNTVKDMTQGNFNLHKTFLDGLMQVSPAVKNYKRVGDIINYQVLLIQESKTGLNRFVKSDSFSDQEIHYFQNVYSGLLNESLRNMAYLIFMIIGILGYFTVPSVANYIVHAGGGGALGQKVTSLFSSSTNSVISKASQGSSMIMDSMGNAASRMSQSMQSSSTTSPYFEEKGNYMSDKLKGNSK